MLLMLEDPRELDDRALAPLCEPPKALLLERLLELGETLRLPTLLPPPLPERLLLPPLPERLRSKLPELAPPPDERLEADCCRDCACDERALAESPRAPPPYLLAVALSLYGAPPRCEALCCH
jgi:hypothetical protein